MRDYILKQEKVYNTFQTEGAKSRTAGVSCGCDSAPCWLCVSREMPKFSVPLFPHLENGQDRGPHFWALDEMVCGKGLVSICMNALFTPHILSTARPRGSLKSSRWLTA